MKKNSRTIALAGVVGAAAMAFTGVTAGYADAGKLPGVYKHKNLGDGSVTIRLYDEAVRVSRAVTNVPTSREVWVSGKVAVNTSGLEGATVTAGYIVGCQLNFGADASGGAALDFDTAGQALINQDDTTVGGGFELSPGKAAFVPIVKAKVDGEDVDAISFSEGRGGIAYSQERFGVDGCAGFAAARAAIKVQVASDTVKGNITAYGKQFSLG